MPLHDAKDLQNSVVPTKDSVIHQDQDRTKVVRGSESLLKKPDYVFTIGRDSPALLCERLRFSRRTRGVFASAADVASDTFFGVTITSESGGTVVSDGSLGSDGVSAVRSSDRSLSKMPKEALGSGVTGESESKLKVNS